MIDCLDNQPCCDLSCTPFVLHIFGRARHSKVLDLDDARRADGKYDRDPIFATSINPVHRALTRYESQKMTAHTGAHVIRQRLIELEKIRDSNVEFHHSVEQTQDSCGRYGSPMVIPNHVPAEMATSRLLPYWHG